MINLDKLDKDLKNFDLKGENIKHIISFVKTTPDLQHFNPLYLSAAFYYIYNYPELKKTSKDQIDQNLESILSRINSGATEQNKILKQKFEIISYIITLNELDFKPGRK